MTTKKKGYYAPTPVIARKIGDALLGAATAITTYAIANHMDGLSFAALWIGVAGKFLSNVFTDDK